MVKQKGTSALDSNDKPEFNYGIPAMDDLSVRRVISSIAPLIPRNYVVMEVKSNLIVEERKNILTRFSAPHFKKISQVVMGEPDDDFTEAVQKKMLKRSKQKWMCSGRHRRLKRTRKNKSRSG